MPRTPLDWSRHGKPTMTGEKSLNPNDSLTFHTAISEKRKL